MGDEDSDIVLEPVNAVFVPLLGSSEILQASSVSENLVFKSPPVSVSLSPAIIAPSAAALRCRRGGREKEDTASRFLAYENVTYPGIWFPALVCFENKLPLKFFKTPPCVYLPPDDL